MKIAKIKAFRDKIGVITNKISTYNPKRRVSAYFLCSDGVRQIIVLTSAKDYEEHHFVET